MTKCGAIVTVGPEIIHTVYDTYLTIVTDGTNLSIVFYYRVRLLKVSLDSNETSGSRDRKF